jgi:hypothetical protein
MIDEQHKLIGWHLSQWCDSVGAILIHNGSVDHLVYVLDLVLLNHIRSKIERRFGSVVKPFFQHAEQRGLAGPLGPDDKGYG